MTGGRRGSVGGGGRGVRAEVEGRLDVIPDDLLGFLVLVDRF